MFFFGGCRHHVLEDLAHEAGRRRREKISSFCRYILGRDPAIEALVDLFVLFQPLPLKILLPQSSCV